MPSSTRRLPAVLLLVVGLVASAALVLLQAPAADAAAASGRVRGYVAAPHGVTPPVRVAWFSADWKYLGSKRVNGGGSYDLSLPAGTYRLQFTDLRPSYDVTKLAATDATVTVRTAHTAVKNVRMHRGAAITGTIRAGGQPAGHATVTAANKAEQSFTTIANDKGQFAIGGLPRGSYSVFTYDRKKVYVAKSTFVKGLKQGHPQNLDLRLNKRGGNLLVDLYAGDHPIKRTVTITAVSKKTGQFWTMKARHGTAVFKGVYPGRYTLVAPGYGEYFARTGAVARGNVHAGRTAFGSFRLTQHGGAFTGRLVSSDAAHAPIAKATVRLYDGSGSIVAATTTAADGTFRVGGDLGNYASISLVAFLGSDMSDYDVLRMRGLKIRIGQSKPLGDVELPVKTGTVTGYVVDASNKALKLAGATVRLVNAKSVVLGETTSDATGSFVFDEELAAQTGVSVVVAPTGDSDVLGTDPTTCEYVSTSHGGIAIEADVTRDLGPVGITRKTGGTCTAPVGDPVTR